ncbi:MAG: type II toxin-antitoxin system HicA family toxin [Gemmatimonadetes bacterium]|nr:type II toxin-antitoxin system HicA family toxin [Gemmatimonadota bacterium]
MGTQSLGIRHERTLAAIFETPVRSDVEWTRVERLLKALGAELTQGRGSRVRISLGGARAVFHRPHPRKEMDNGSVQSMKEFLTRAGVTP